MEFLDDFSVSFIRECLHGRRYRQAFGEMKYGFNRPKLMDSLSNLSITGESSGRIAFLCVHVPLYNSPTAKSVVDDITRSHRSLSVPIIEVGEASLPQLRHLHHTMTSLRFDDRLVYTLGAASGYCPGYAIERSAAIGQMQPERLENGLKPLVQITEDLCYTIPFGCLREYRKVPVMKIGPHIAMRYGHVYDELPPVLQIFCKCLAVVSQCEYYWVPRSRIWEVLNDLIAEGVDDQTMKVIMDEMTTMYVVKRWTVNSIEYIKFQSPAMADIALDVCTPVQVEAIAKAWIDRLSVDTQTDFRVSLVLAWLHVMIDPSRQCKTTMDKLKLLWQSAYSSVLQKSKEEAWSASKENRWKELIASDIEAAEFNVYDVLGADFSYGAVETKGVNLTLMRIWWYRGPIALGPLGNTLSVIGGLILEGAILADKTADERLDNLRRHLASSTQRYMVEVEILEELLSEHGLGSSLVDLHREKELIEQISAPPSSKSTAFQFAEILMESVVSHFVANRVDRLRQLAKKLESSSTPPFVANSSCEGIKMAYRVMYEIFCDCKSQGSEVDSAQHALMVLATRSWQPRPTPEPMNHLYRQTVARLRNAVVRKLSEGQLHYTRHQQSAVDLKAFLISTGLLFDAQDTGRYMVNCK